MGSTGNSLKRIFGAKGTPSVGRRKLLSRFHSPHYLRHNARRLEHLASLRIPVASMSVLEVGAGIGDHSHYYTDRGCRLTITEAREENLEVLRELYPEQKVTRLDMEKPVPLADAPFDVVHCYGLLYHLRSPGEAIEQLNSNCRKLLFLETCVSFGNEQEVHLTEEHDHSPTQAVSGLGCRPTRRWIFERLRERFDHVYVPLTQPNHPEFPLDWTAPEDHLGLARCVFVASREDLGNDALSPELLDQQLRHP